MAPDMITPPSAPLMNTAPTKTAQDAPGDDIADPELPVGLQEQLMPPTREGTPPTLPDTFGKHPELLPLFQGFCQHLQKTLEKTFMEYASTTFKEMGASIDDAWQYTKRCLDIDQEKLHHAETLLDRLTTKAVEQGIHLRQDHPYTATLNVLSPHGYGIAITITHADQGALIAELGTVMGQLGALGCTAIVPVGQGA